MYSDMESLQQKENKVDSFKAWDWTKEKPTKKQEGKEGRRGEQA